MRCFTLLYFILIFLLQSLLVKHVSAVTTSISNLPQSISSEPFTVKVDISGANTGTNYLKIDLFKPLTSNYFGETFNGLEWYTENDYTRYYSINIEPNEDWSGELQGKIGSPSSSQYDNPGLYKLRVRRFTSSGNYNSTEANSSSVDINIDALIPTQTPSLEPTEIIEPTEITISSKTSQTYKNVYISEVLVDPEEGSNEWIEIYNANEFEINLNNWLIDDLENSGSTPRQFSLTIPSKTYSTYELANSIFNNSGDSVRLLDFEQKVIDGFQYNSSEKGKTQGRISFENDNFCLQTPTKNMKNNSCVNPTSKALNFTSTPSLTINIVKVASTTGVISKHYLRTTPINFILFNQNQSNITGLTDQVKAEVLGVTTQDQPENNQVKALLSSLTFASFSYSLLAAFSIIYKVKINT